MEEFTKQLIEYQAPDSKSITLECSNQILESSPGSTENPGGGIGF